MEQVLTITYIEGLWMVDGAEGNYFASPDRAEAIEEAKFMVKTEQAATYVVDGDE